MPATPSDTGSTLRLPDGRHLTFTDTGPRGGSPVIYCHGAIGSPLRDSVDLRAITARLGVRHIAINRPGFGGSDALRNRCVLQFAQDVAAVADALSLDGFSLVGVSAGGPYALATARSLRDRVLRVAVCSSLSPLCAPHRRRGWLGASGWHCRHWRARPDPAARSATASCRSCGVIRACCTPSSPPTPPRGSGLASPSRASAWPPVRAFWTQRHMVSAG